MNNMPHCVARKKGFFLGALDVGVKSMKTCWYEHLISNLSGDLEHLGAVPARGKSTWALD